MSNSVELGRCTEDGFESSSWCNWDETEVEELRQVLIEVYFEERVAEDPLPQREWPDTVVSFLNIETLPTQAKLEPLVTLEEKELDVKKRFVNEEGFPCQGLYREPESGDLLLLKKGCLVERRRPTEGYDGDGAGVLSAESLGPWYDKRGDVLDLEAVRWKRMEDGQASVGQFHFGLDADLHEKGLEMERKGWQGLVFPHLEKDGHSRLVCWVGDKMNDLLSDEKKSGWLKKYPDVTVDWEQGYKNILAIETDQDVNAKAYGDLNALLEGVPPAWVLADHVD